MGSFDRIDHKALLRKLNTTPTFRRAIRAWLRAGVMDGPTLFPTEEGTPQGGVISPLLMNAALHGLETAVQAAFPAHRPQTATGRWWIAPVKVVRYADDLVVMHKELFIVAAAQQLIAGWLQEMGLELKPSKTRIVHTLREHDGQAPGFNFLGFHVRQYPVGKRHSGKKTNGTLLGFKTRITPSNDARKRHRQVLKTTVTRLHAAPQGRVIHDLNPVIRGWANYFRTVVATDIFEAEDELLYLKLRRWAKRRHPKWTQQRAARKYWRPGKHGNWTFQTPEGQTLAQHTDVHIQRHVKVQGGRSYFDGDWSYWGARLGRHPDLTPLEARLLKQQRGRCARCKLHFVPGDITEKDHIIPVSLGGGHGAENRQLLHGHCHDEKTAGEQSRGRRCS